MKVPAGGTSPFRIDRTKLAVTVLFGIVWLLSTAPASATPITTIAISPSLKTAFVGDTLLLDVSIANVDKLFDYQFDVTFDPTILRANPIAGGAFLSSGGGTSVFGGAFPLTVDNATGLVTILDSLTGPAPPAIGTSGTGILASLSFTALVAGASGVNFANVLLEDSTGTTIFAQAIDGSILVTSETTAVPEPATIFLLASGLAIGFTRMRGVRPAHGRTTKSLS